VNGLRLRSNPATLLAYRNLTQTQFGLNNTLQRLSSGLRINKAADDSAGSAISTRMNNQILGMKQANENSQQANNLIQTADSGLNDIGGMLSRMRELATQASTDTLNASDRASIDLEFQTLKNEISRVAHATEYNEMNLLNGTDYKNEVHRVHTTADDVIGISVKNANLSHDIRKGIYTLSDEHIDVSGLADISNLSDTAITDIRYSSSSLQPALGETYTIKSQVNSGAADIDSLSSTDVSQLRHSTSPIVLPGDHTITAHLDASDHANISGLSGTAITEIRHNASSAVQPGDHTISARLDASDRANIGGLSSTAITEIRHDASPAVQPGDYTVSSKVNAGTINISNVSGTSIIHGNSPVTQPGDYTVSSKVNAGTADVSNFVNINKINHSASIQPGVYSINSQVNPNTIAISQATIDHTSSSSVGNYVVSAKVNAGTADISNLAGTSINQVSHQSNVQPGVYTLQVASSNSSGTTFTYDPALSSSNRLLTNDFLTVGINHDASLINTSLGNTSVVFDPDGTSGPKGPSGDFFYPGSPLEGFTVKYEIGGSTQLYRNAHPQNSPAISFNVRDHSTATHQVSVANGTTPDGNLEIEQVVSLKEGSRVLRFDLTFENVGSQSISNLKYLRNADPDQDSGPHGTTYTYNDALTLASGEVAASAVGEISGHTVVIGSVDEDAVVSAGRDFAITDPDVVLNSPNDPNGGKEDNSINVAKNLMGLSSGETKTMTFFYTFGENVSDALSTLDHAGIPVVTMTVTAPSGLSESYTHVQGDSFNGKVDLTNLGIEMDINNIDVLPEQLTSSQTFTIDSTLVVTAPDTTTSEVTYNLNDTSVDFSGFGLQVDTSNASAMTADLLNTPKTFIVNPTLEVTPPVGSAVETGYSFNSNSQTVDFSSLGIDVDTSNAATMTAGLLDSVGEFTVNARLTATAPDGTHQEIKYSSSAESQTVSFDTLGLDVDSDNAQTTATQLLDNSKDFTVNPTLAVNSPNTGPVEEIGYQFHSSPQTIDFSRLGLEIDTNEAPKTTTTLLGASQDFFVPETRKLTMTGENGVQQSLEYRVGYDTMLDFNKFGIQLDIKGSSDHSTPSIDSYNPHTDSLDGKQIEIAPNRDLQVGVDNDVNHQLKLGITSVTASGLEIEDESVADINQARSAITSLDVAIDVVNQERSYLGAEQNRLAFTMSNLTNQTQSIETSRSSIQDADFASDAASLAKNQILAQSTTAMLAQANAISQNILSLITA